MRERDLCGRSQPSALTKRIVKARGPTGDEHAQRACALLQSSSPLQHTPQHFPLVTQKCSGAVSETAAPIDDFGAAHARISQQSRAQLQAVVNLRDHPRLQSPLNTVRELVIVGLVI